MPGLCEVEQLLCHLASGLQLCFVVAKPPQAKQGGKPLWRLGQLLPESPGNVQFSFKALMNNVAGLADTLRQELYPEPALVPASPWLGGRRPKAPQASITDVSPKRVAIEIAPTKRSAAARLIRP